MTAQELIDHLRTLPRDTEVVIGLYSMGGKRREELTTERLVFDERRGTLKIDAEDN